MLRIEFRSPLRFEYEVRAKLILERFIDDKEKNGETFTLKDLKFALEVKTLQN